MSASLIIPIFGILIPVPILAIIFGYIHYSERRFHQTVQRMIDNGQELNEDILSGIPGYKKVMPRDDIRSGINTIGTGIGLSLLGLVGLGSIMLGIGLLVACIGGAMVTNGYLNRTKEN